MFVLSLIVEVLPTGKFRVYIFIPAAIQESQSQFNQSINQSFYLVMQVYRVAAIRLMWTYNELLKYKTKITYKITLWYLNIQYESLK